MDRRLGGGIALLAALFAVVVVSAVAQTGAGHAVAEPVRPVPQVGDCRLIGPDDGTPGSVDGTAGRLVPCDGARSGEVVAIVTGTGPEVPPGALRRDDGCRRDAAAWMGWQSADAGIGTWYPVATFDGMLAGPDARQRASGQRWTACVLIAASPLGGTGRLDGSARGAFAQSGAAVAPFALCRDQPDGVPVSCLDAHRVEVFASVDIAPGSTDDWLQQTCRDQVSTATGMTDPTAGGALVVAAHIPTVAVPDDAAANFSAECAVTVTAGSDRVLVSTLRNLGTAPVPFDE
ncbi:septum formation family protein [Nakamurella leprariae]|uniref:Septum formation family protein n=1 Tax=Nakamurella leprariae TaxID=2803911 RepID=A0A938Y8C9_9ACTN|nr:septum formation family protein [Nakamurella leprariae]MBM9465842.1 septum formation family protein [Nakamurella leprariae]